MSTEWKCGKCAFNGVYLLGPDECGAGQFNCHCKKGHWDGSFEIENDDGIYDPWEDCADFVANISQGVG